MPERIKRYQPEFIAFCLYATLTVVMTWPLATQLGTHIPGFVGDSFVHLWTFNWVKESLLSAQSPFYTDALFYPSGTSLVFHNIAWVNILAWLFLQTFMSGAAAYSLVHMGVLVLNGFATFLLAQEITQSYRASFIAGMICAFWPFILSHQDHPNLIFVAWIPLALLFLRRMFAEGRIKDALLTALFLILTGITRWQVLIMAAPIVGLYVLYMLLAKRSTRNGRIFKLLLLVFVVTFICLLPLAAPLIYSQITRSYPDDLFVSENLYATDLLGFVIPSRYHPLWGDEAFSITWRFEGNMSYVPFLGYTTIVLAITGVVGAWRKARFWLLASMFYGILTLGPSLNINGLPTAVPLPYALVQEWFVVQAIRFPERLNIMLSIPVAILAAVGITVLFRIRWVSDHKNLVSVGLASLIAIEFIIAFPSLALDTPKWYESAAQEAGEFAILDVPMNMREIYDKQYMHYQATHKRPIVEGHVSRPPREAFEFIDSIPILRDIRDQRNPPAGLGDISHQLQLLDDAGVRYLVLHKRFLRDSHEAAWRQWLAVPPSYEDDEIMVYPTEANRFGEGQVLTHVMLENESQPQLGLVQVGYSPQQTGPGGWVQADLWWSSSEPLLEDLSVCLRLVPESGSAIKVNCELISPDRATSDWRANEITRSQHFFQIDPDWANGNYRLAAHLKNEAGDSYGQEAILGDLRLESSARSFEEPAVKNEVNGNWQDIILLKGYDHEVRNNTLEMLLYWQALDNVNTSYKMFLHLIDNQSGELVGQIDYIPQSWSYPTDWWVDGEFIADPVSLSLDGLPGGEYQIWLGIYDPDDGERLSITNEVGMDVVNRALLLTTITHE